jgi:phosphohistidine swiveling domain-containing protein
VADAAQIVWLGSPACARVSLVGGKAANLSRLAASYLVPPGFCVTADAFPDPGAEAPGIAAGESGALPAALLAQVGAAYEALARRCGVADPPVAVRSSAVDEDGSVASFAGQHETYLNVRGLERVAAAIASCRASLRLPRALAYRRERAVATGGARLAVLVQQLVPADVSGVLFTANPVSLARDEVVLTASWGLGESVVGGTVTPDTFVVQKRPLAVRARRIGAKRRMTVTTPNGTADEDVPVGLRELPVLDDAHVLDAAMLGVRLEAEFGYPVDVELAWRTGALYVLQCRPVTALAPAGAGGSTPAPRPAAPGEARRTRLTDLLGQPPASTPSTVRSVTADALPPGEWTRHWHYPLPVTPLYADFELAAHLPLADVVGRDEYAKMTSFLPRRRERRMAFLVVDGYVYRMANTVEQPAPGPAAPGGSDPPAAGPEARDGYEWVMWRRWVEETRPRIAAGLRRFRAARLDELADGALLEHVRALSLLLVETWAHEQSNAPAFDLIRRRCAAFCAQRFGLSEAEFLGLFAGCSEATSAPVTAMEALAARVRRDPALAGALRGATPWADRRIRALLASYVEAYGHKATDWEYVTPTLAERPERVVELLREAVARLDDGTAGAADEARSRRRSLERSLRARLADAVARRRFAALLRDAQAVFGIHEDNVNLYNLGEGYMRYALLEAGRRFRQRGLLTDRERVFFLRRPELESLLEGASVAGLSELTEARRRAYEDQKGRRPARVVRGPSGRAGARETGAPPAAAVPPGGGLPGVPAGGAGVRGLGASPGTYEGPARVVLTEDQFEQVRAGDVLVSPQTTPSWTILFGRIGALVTDDGGILSHSAIASREFGIPAVLSTGVATTTFVTGQRVRVDGGSGVVSVVAGAPRESA